ncbi:hypothetical protein HBB16_03370 [Pseudonocardia sp. MCCB 268]|nr:hypothetical protein [Pseudonocardia cytotoxica]
MWEADRARPPRRRRRPPVRRRRRSTQDVHADAVVQAVKTGDGDPDDLVVVAHSFGGFSPAGVRPAGRARAGAGGRRWCRHRASPDRSGGRVPGTRCFHRAGRGGRPGISGRRRRPVVPPSMTSPTRSRPRRAAARARPVGDAWRSSSRGRGTLAGGPDPVTRLLRRQVLPGAVRAGGARAPAAGRGARGGPRTIRCRRTPRWPGRSCAPAPTADHPTTRSAAWHAVAACRTPVVVLRSACRTSREWVRHAGEARHGCGRAPGPVERLRWPRGTHAGSGSSSSSTTRPARPAPGSPASFTAKRPGTGALPPNPARRDLPEPAPPESPPARRPRSGVVRTDGRVRWWTGTQVLGTSGVAAGGAPAGRGCLGHRRRRPLSAR